MRKVRGLFTLFGLSFFAAILFTIFMLDRFGPTGQYLAANTIVSPTTLHTMNVQDEHSKTNRRIYYSFDTTEFSYFDRTEGRMHQVKVDPTTYETFYYLVASNKSIEPTQDIDRQFNQSQSVTLTTTVRSDKTENPQDVRVFQIIQFTDRDYFRVQLKGQQNAPEWAYFYQPTIYQKVIRLFTQNAI